MRGAGRVGSTDRLPLVTREGEPRVLVLLCDRDGITADPGVARGIAQISARARGPRLIGVAAGHWKQHQYAGIQSQRYPQHGSEPAIDSQ